MTPDQRDDVIVVIHRAIEEAVGHLHPSTADLVLDIYNQAGVIADRLAEEGLIS